LKQLDQYEGTEKLSLILQDVLTNLSLDIGLGGNSLFSESVDVESIFSKVVKLLASKNLLVKKLSGWIILIITNNPNFKSHDLHLLAVNSLVRNYSLNPEFMSKGKSLVTMCQLKCPNSMEPSSTSTRKQKTCHE